MQVQIVQIQIFSFLTTIYFYMATADILKRNDGLQHFKPVYVTKNNHFNTQLYIAKHQCFINNRKVTQRQRERQRESCLKLLFFQRYCNNFVITPSRSEWKVCINIEGIKLA